MYETIVRRLFCFWKEKKQLYVGSDKWSLTFHIQRVLGGISATPFPHHRTAERPRVIQSYILYGQDTAAVLQSVPHTVPSTGYRPLVL